MKTAFIFFNISLQYDSLSRYGIESIEIHELVFASKLNFWYCDNTNKNLLAQE